jgi:broad specificity phosphatase PhoE
MMAILRPRDDRENAMSLISDANATPLDRKRGVEDPLRVYLVRHGETPWSLTGQHTGKTDISLTPHGEEQSRALASVLDAITFDHVLTSPAVRARQTCELAGFAGQAVVDADFAEWDYGEYEGRRTIDIRKVRPGWNVFQDGSPGGESVRTVTARADRASASLRALSGTVLVFSHGQFGCSLAARWIGLPIVEAQHFTINPASISVLGFNPAHPELAIIAHWNHVPTMMADESRRVRIGA